MKTQQSLYVLWISAAALCPILPVPSTAQTGGPDIVVYEDDLKAPWFHNTFNSSVILVSPEQAHTGSSSMKVSSTSAWGWVSMHYGPWNTQGFDPNPYESVEFAIYPTSRATSVAVFFENDQDTNFPKIPRGTFNANEWTIVSVPMSELNPGNKRVGRVFIQDFSGEAKTYYVDNMKFVSSSQAVPFAPVPESPENGSTGVTVDPRLSWHPALTANSYRVQVSTSSAFVSPVFNQDGITETAITAGTLANNTTYFWRVNATNVIGTSEWSEVWSFTTKEAAVSAPTLTSPEDGATRVPVNTTFAWNASPGADSYRLQVSANNAFSPAVVDQPGIAGTSATANGLSHSTMYYWRVSAQNTAGASGWSNVRKFTTIATPLSSPVLASPSDEATNQATSLLFAWGKVSGADSYQLQVSETASFSAIVADQPSITDTSSEVDGLSEDTRYYWRVCARNAEISSNWSPVWSFTTAPGGTAMLSLVTTIPFPSRSERSEYSPMDYRIVGLPGGSGSPIAGYLSGTAGEDWQVYWDNGDSANYLVSYNGGAEFTCSAGRAFWMIKTSPWSINTAVPACPLNAAQEAEIPLHSGWNLITNPFLSPRAWSLIQSLNSTNELLYGFESAGFFVSDSLRPYNGYYFFNATNLTTLRIPSPSSSSESLRPVAGVAPNSGEWRVRITAWSGSSVDASLWFGAAEGARRGLDPADVRKPGRFTAGEVTVCFRRPDWDAAFDKFATDIRPLAGGMESWNFELESPGLPVSFAFEGIGTIPAALAVYIVDKQSERAVDLRTEGQYNVLPSAGITEFEILVGTPGEVLKRIRTSDGVRRTALGSNYPNPFNASTNIPFELAEDSMVKIAVYNTLGEEVETLLRREVKAGRHNVSWNGTDRDGVKAPSGVYYYHLTADDGQTITRSMMLLK